MENYMAKYHQIFNDLIARRGELLKEHNHKQRALDDTKAAFLIDVIEDFRRCAEEIERLKGCNCNLPHVNVSVCPRCESKNVHTTVDGKQALCFDCHLIGKTKC